ncbi:hypothetical protein ACT6QH_12990 [Xanthobacter sp. TB0139]|uniref:hypothetical protein n=1 Tax=Xanthobacter sp. TB0139 TaxID=3459178 RepID=UPI00403A33BE
MARWSLHLAFLSAFLLLLASYMASTNQISAISAAQLMIVSSGVACLASGMGSIAFVRLWENGWIGMGRACWAIIISAAVLAGPVILIARDVAGSQMQDVSTNPDDPPRFRALIMAHPQDILALLGLEELSRRPMKSGALKTLEVASMPGDVFQKVLAEMRARGWRFASDLTGKCGENPELCVEAVADFSVTRRTFHIVFRVREAGGLSLVDIRLVPRDAGSGFSEGEALLQSVLTNLKRRMQSGDS